MKHRLTGVLLAAAVCAISSTASAQTAAPLAVNDKPVTRFQLLPAPSFEFKDIARVDLHFKLQEDHRGFPEQIEPDDPWTLARGRVAVEGLAVKVVAYRVERDFVSGGRWTDVFADYLRSDALGVRGGKFKEPFSLEQTTSDFSLPFVLRPAIARDLAPGRGHGVMAHGRTARRMFYELGVFSHDGENAAFADNPGGDTTIAGRARLQAWGDDETSVLRTFRLGVAATECPVPAGLNSLRARAIDGTPIVPRAYVNGPRVRFGTELSWMPGPFDVRSEFIEVWEDRAAQGAAGQDLPRLTTGGWYVSGSWLLTHDKAADVPSPRSPLFQGGIGAIEAAARYERLWSGGDAQGQIEADSPRAPNLVESGYGAWTFGVNWYVNRWGKIQFNAIHESFDPPTRSRVPSRSGYWSTLWRFEFVL